MLNIIYLSVNEYVKISKVFAYGNIISWIRNQENYNNHVNHISSHQSQPFVSLYKRDQGTAIYYEIHILIYNSIIEFLSFGLWLRNLGWCSWLVMRKIYNTSWWGGNWQGGQWIVQENMRRHCIWGETHNLCLNCQSWWAYCCSQLIFQLVS